MKAKGIVYPALGAVVIALCTMISIPTAVPFTMQTFAVFLVLALLGGKAGLASVAVYIALGIVGVPVFAGFQSGVSVLVGPTGGYIVGFVLIALAKLVGEAMLGHDRLTTAVSLAIGLVLCYTFGTLWFAIGYMKGEIGFGAAIVKCVLPFVLPDTAKLACALVLAKRLKKLL